LELEREARTLQKVKDMRPAARIRQDEAGRLRAQAEPLKIQARLEDVHLWQMEKVKSTKKGSREYAYWMATWWRAGRREISIYTPLHASSVKTGMHRIGLLNFFMPNFAVKARAHRGLISINFEFWHNYKV